MSKTEGDETVFKKKTELSQTKHTQMIMQIPGFLCVCVCVCVCVRAHVTYIKHTDDETARGLPQLWADTEQHIACMWKIRLA